mgnify:CR=1 FL=1
MLAVIRHGGKQYLVKEGDRLSVEKIKLEKPDAKEYSFQDILLVADDKAGIKIGQPVVAGAKVKAEVVTPEYKEKKVTVIKFKSKKRYTRKRGHRQIKSRIVIGKITV